MASATRAPRRGQSTRAVQAGRHAASLGPAGETAHAPPLFQTTNFTYPSAAAADRAAGGGAYLYTRDANPTTDALAAAVADLEEGEAGLAFASGMAAIAAATFAYAGRGGDGGDGGEVLASEGLYGGTTELLREIGPLHGVGARFVPAWDTAAVAAAIGPRTRALLVETISNPLLRVADLPALAALCQARDVALLVDSTFASPVLCRPLAHGATVVVHSASKYIGGHGDIIAGVAVGSREAMDRMRRYRLLLGGVMDPFCGWLALRGLRTMPLRVERQCRTAALLADRLADLPGVQRVHYPGRSDHPDHERARRLLGAPGAMISFALADGTAARRFYDRVEVFGRAASLGEVSSLVTHPASFSHKGLPAAERERQGIGDGLLRLSVGLEDADDLLADLTAALS